MLISIMEDKQTIVHLGIYQGEHFQDLQKFEDNLKAVCKSKFIQMYRKDARTIESAMRKKIMRTLDPSLKFYSVRWCCIHGGRKFQSRGKGLRKTRTFRQESLCPAFVHVRVAESGTEFRVVDVNYNHNHVVTKDSFEHLPHNRIPSDTDAKISRAKYRKTIAKAKVFGTLASELDDDEFHKINMILDAVIRDLQNGTNDFLNGAISLINKSDNGNAV